MVLFEKTPKAFATFSPGFKIEIVLNPERARQPPNPFRVFTTLFVMLPGLSLALQPWAEISQRLRRIGKLNQCRIFIVEKPPDLAAPAASSSFALRQ